MSETSGSTLSDYQAMNRAAFVLGYTGEVGKELVKALNKSKPFSKVVLIGRGQIDLDPNLGPEFEQKVVDFDQLDDYSDAFKDTYVGYCCLGANKKAGKDGFIKVDKDYVLKSAEIAKQQGCQQFSFVSSSGSNKNSWFLYPRTKGEVEETLSKMEFERLSIFKPAFLLCKRQESRPGEKFARGLMAPLLLMFPTHSAVQTSIMGEAMVADTIAKTNNAVTVYDNNAIHRLVKPKT